MGKSATVFNPDLVNVYLLIHEKNVILYRINKSVGSIDILRLFGTREDYSEKIRRLLDE